MSTMTTQKIEIPYPDTGTLELGLRTGPCRIRFFAKEQPSWIAGTYDDPTGMLPLEVTPGPRTLISQRFDLTAFNVVALPTLELSFGKTRPFAMEIQTGASENLFDLGGIPLTRLVVKAGAGRFDLDWSAPNPAAMALLDVSAGAGAVSARHLANANFGAMRYGGGVAACTLDFGGTLTRDATVRIDSGLGAVDLIVPATTAMSVRTKAFASGRRVSGGFVARGDDHLTRPALEGARPIIEVEVSLAFGSLGLTTS